MKYYFIAGEASGDLHASHLIAALKAQDPTAEFRGFGGDLMQQQGLTLVRHYRDLAFMGLVAVVMHLRTILRGMKQCREDIETWKPDVVILVDYPGFNLKIAKFVHERGLCPVYYYIAPKLWAWKEWRIKEIRRNVDEIFSILPFEVDFFEGKHHYPIHYIGNPTVDEVAAFKKASSSPDGVPIGLPDGKPYIALLSGSRTHEIRDNLPRMIAAAEPFMKDYRLIVAGAPSITPEHYKKYIGQHPVEVVYNQTYNLLSGATAALVTSGTATLETALFRVPQVVCYFMQFRQIASLLRKLLIKVPYISLVNLIAGREVVPELVAEQMTVKACRRHLASILPGGEAREAQLQGYDEMARKLGEPGAPRRAAEAILHCLGKDEQQRVIISRQLEQDLDAAINCISPDRLFVLTDTTTLQACWPVISRFSCLKDAQMITIGATDEAKTLDSLSAVWTALGEGGATRHSALVNLGGGMVTDLGGFAAATFKRGIQFINLPTTLLAMVDASVGGKTGINYRGLKNEIGVFRTAGTVILDTQFLKSLDARNLRSGYAEMLKHGLISTEEHLSELLTFDLENIDYERLKTLVGQSVAIKERIVAEDPLEHGLRKALNLGHTAGHAFESLALEEGRTVLHGYAVAWGLVCELYLSATRCGFPTERLRQVCQFVRETYGQFFFDCKVYERLYEFMTHDKKNAAGVINFTLLGAVGDVRINQQASMKDIFEMLDFYREM